ncbi:unnamed protein product [Calicophoron daubneyi]|uniref:Dolichyl-diphosphooligosaccharide--protein glycosyltransferase subunit 1 n=1 Tax=Calicophoron daubneyi TaxID=300641 RepID=A0AAV2TDK1_CALDB
MSALLVAWFCFAFLHPCLGVTNLNVTRRVDLTSPVVRIEHTITVDDGSKDYQFLIHPSDLAHLSLVSAWVDKNKAPLKVSVDNRSPDKYTVTLPKSSSKSVEFTVLTVFIEELEPKPAEIVQDDNQFVKYTGSAVFYSPYPTNHQEMIISLPEGDVLSYTTSPQPVQKRSKKLIYGPYTDKPALSYAPVYVHFEDNVPFLTVTKMTRLIEISHWGNIAVEESIDIINEGAKLRGSFSRLDFDMGRGRRTAVTSFKTALPAAAKDIYYRDEVGNISSSAVMDLLDAVEVRLSPRFPLMGGWKTQYILGYNVPAHQFLYHTGSQFQLRMRFMDHVYDDQVVKDFTLKIVLPEEVTEIEFVPPYPVTEEPRENLKTYLDTTGRTVLVFKAKNLVNEHIKDFVLNYHFNMLLMLREPLMLVAAFCVVFFCALVYVRLDFSIFRDEKAELRQRVQATVDEAMEIYRKRSALYQSYEDAIHKYKVNKDSSAFESARKRLEAEHKDLNQQLTRVQTKMGEFYSDGTEKLKECASLDVNYRDLVQNSVQLAERLISGKLTKPQYQTSDNDISAKKTDLIYRMDTIMESL